MTTIIAPRVHDLGGFQVRRAVPSVQARSVGPFVFVDHMGPAVFEPGRGIGCAAASAHRGYQRR